ncbi:DUF58 domain-containing protein [Dasania sp. GY-MA-18]|uniref:DUF58 domain-containing protein n=1 Tax=Dasania phycosphaerae TaxID=2950436 RepID=A0A9J6RMA0_9GAMM|nr:MULTISPECIES: DUF58 domain-containing protein [Dasania]MCR8922880.1 DUF58 domain-containing protein [Dasania sp. GY-MA-18]MCZ0865311.1 DUF58 domain-containing protein [Dasania phycosphaerae]MCZ0869036.1 DUF58 domain-containing protein [Dasania phycosphaerae]
MSQPQPQNSLEQPVTGAYIALEDLLRARFAATDLKLKHRRKALSLLAGPNKTNFRGRGIDFEEVRNYQAGDDIRTIDWRVTARSGKPHTKLFSEERERPLLIVNDQRQGMFFGSQHCFKSTLACYLSALIAWSGLQQGDRVGGLVFGNQGQQELKPKRSRQAVLALMKHMGEYNHLLNRSTGIQLDNSERLKNSLRELRRIARPGSAIYFISDFSGYEDEDVQKQLFLLSRHCEITAIYVYDPLEQTLPSAGLYTISDGQQRRPIFTGDSKLRQHYQQQFNDKLQNLHAVLGKLGIPLIEMATNQAPLKHLLTYFGRGR